MCYAAGRRLEDNEFRVPGPFGLSSEGDDLLYVQPLQPTASHEIDPDARENRDSDDEDYEADDDGHHLFPKVYKASAMPKYMLPASFASWSPAVSLGS